MTSDVADAPLLATAEPRRRLTAALMLALVGLGIAAYAWWMHAARLPGLACGASDSPLRCDVIILDAYAKPLGVPVPLLGLIGYALLALASAWLLLAARVRAAVVVPALVVRGLLAGAATVTAALLTFQASKVGSFCPVCGASAATVVTLTVLHLATPLRLSRSAERRPALLRRRTFAVGVIVLVMATTAGVGVASSSWDPRAEYRERALTFLDTLPPPPPPTEPQVPRAGDAPWLVCLYREGCPYCEQFFAIEVPAFADALRERGYEVRKASLDVHTLTFDALDIHATPALAVQVPPLPDGAGGYTDPRTETLIGYRDTAALLAWFASLDMPAPTRSEAADN